MAEPSAPTETRAWPELPTGAVTFLFTDLEGSTRLLDAHPVAYREAVRRHHALLREAVEANGGVVFETVGDAVYAAFARPTDAVAAALAGQVALRREPWGATGELRVRMGLHLGEVERQGGHYFGAPLYRCARLTAAAHGGQVVLSAAVAEVVRDALPAGAGLRDLGEHRLKDLQRPEHLFQLVPPGLPGDFPPLRSLDALSHNLPLQLTSFVGRERELGEVAGLLGTQRLVTLTGPGGTGKTRLALQAAADSLGAYPDGVRLAELEALADPALVPQAAAAAVGVREEPGRPLVATLSDALRPKRLLLVLDNCEHLLDACARLADALLRACPDLRVLATSREALGIAGETAWRVPSLALPDAAHPPPVEALTQYPAVRLFVERAAAARPAFAVTDHNAPAVARVCARLDGIPLALELAAARVRVLPVEQLLSRLEDRFRLLTGGSRTALARHQTLRAAVDWSYALLTEPERRLFDRLAVFAGGWTLEAAEAVGAGDGIAGDEVLDLLARLVDKSLVVADEHPAGTARYRLLETLRQYAGEALAAGGAAEAARERHAQYFLALAEAAHWPLYRAGARAWLDRLEQEHDNLREALRWAAGRADAALGVRLAGALYRFWNLHGHLSEGRAWLAAALARADRGADADRDDPGGAPARLARATALNGAGVLAREQGDYRAARSCFAASLAILREWGAATDVANALRNLGSVAARQGDYGASRALLDESLALTRAAGFSSGTAVTLTFLAELETSRGNAAAAERFCAEGLASARETGSDFFAARLHYEWGVAALEQGKAALAGARLAEGLALARDLEEPRTIAWALEGFAGLAAAQGRPRRALRLAGAAAALRAALGTPPAPHEAARLEGWLAPARGALGEAASAATWAAGRALALADAVAYALTAEPGPYATAGPASGTASGPPDTLAAERGEGALAGRQGRDGCAREG